jgi:hypothetical protein
MASQDVGVAVRGVVGEMVEMCVGAVVGVAVKGSGDETVGLCVGGVAVGLGVVGAAVGPLVVGLGVGMIGSQHSEQEQPCATVSAHVQPN